MYANRIRLSYHCDIININKVDLCNDKITLNNISKHLYIRSAQFLYNMYNSCNSIVQTCFMNSLYNSNSVIGSKIAYFRAKYRINFTTSTELCPVIVLLGLLKTNKLVLTICFPSYPPDQTSHLKKDLTLLQLLK